MKVKLSNKKVIDTIDISSFRMTPTRLYDDATKKPFKCNYCIEMNDGNWYVLTKTEMKKLWRIKKKSERSDKE